MTSPPIEPVEIFLASRNAKKLAELQRILDQHLPDITVLGLDDVTHYEEPVEDQKTFAGNALVKARAGFRETGLPTLADDSGLCVDELNDMPGVLSARWAGTPKSDDANNALLLQQLADVPDERRGAEFRCTIALVHAGGEVLVDGVMRGRVIREQRGDGGFGYDVIFVADDTADGRTSAELSVAEKDAISHRGRALREIAPVVADALS